MSRGIHPQENPLFAHGETFGRLTVLHRARTAKNCGPRYHVGCVCGHRFIARGSKLRKGEITACLKCTSQS